jgi:hypothetical protein
MAEAAHQVAAAVVYCYTVQQGLMAMVRSEI